jgi:hypothetical protein
MIHGDACFAYFNKIWGIPSVTSLVGLGAPDAGAARHAATMKFLEQQFKEINIKLDRIIDLQVQTLKTIAELADNQRRFRTEVLSQLDRIEAAVLSNNQILQAIMLDHWKDCHALINGALNGQYDIPNQAVLLRILGDLNAETFTSGCYSTMVGFLDAWVRPGAWSGQIIAAANFPTDVIVGDEAASRAWKAYVSQQIEAYKTARDFLLEAVPSVNTEPALFLARLAQPVFSAKYQEQLSSALLREDTRSRLANFDCSDREALSEALASLLCFGLPKLEGRPLNGRVRQLLEAALIGPHAFRIIDTGDTLSSLVDLGNRQAGGTFQFVKAEDIKDFANSGMSDALRLALNQRKGQALLTKLQWLSEIMVLQQGVAFGEFTALLIERALYDPKTRTLRTKAGDGPDGRLVALALAALRANPILARNVVTLAMRHAIADSVGSVETAKAIRFNETYYKFARSDFRGEAACQRNRDAMRRLRELLPNWTFELRVTAEEKKQKELALCEVEVVSNLNVPNPAPSLGAGLAVKMENFYVLAPSPLALTEGYMEQPDSLRLALARIRRGGRSNVVWSRHTNIGSAGSDLR